MATAATNPTNLRPIGDDDQTLSVFRTPPHNFEAEKALLGAVFANNNAYDRVSDFLRPEHFADPLNGRIFEAASKLIERRQIADPITLKNFFEQDGSLSEVGGTEYLAEIAGSMVTIINVSDYARTIYDLHLKRQLIDLGENMVNDAHSPEVDSSAFNQIETAEQRLYELATTGEVEGGPRQFSSAVTTAIEMAEAAYKRESHLVGVATGLMDLDDLLGGLHPSDLIILAARPAMGKTSLATKIALEAASDYKEDVDDNGKKRTLDGAVVGFFSLEMSAEQLAGRILSEQTEINSDRLRTGKLTEGDFQKLVAASQMLHRLPLFIDDTPALSVSALRTRARRLQREHNLGLIVVDYLQLMEASGHYDSRVQEIGEISRGLKSLAKELNVPVLALSQLSRAVEARDDKTPQLSDLRESGTIEQDADVVMFIYRDSYYLELKKPKAISYPTGETDSDYQNDLNEWQKKLAAVEKEADIIVAKQRHGPTGESKVFFDRRYTRFGNHTHRNSESF